MAAHCNPDQHMVTMNLEARLRKKFEQLKKEFEKPKLDARSIVHLNRDMAAAAEALASKPK